MCACPLAAVAVSKPRHTTPACPPSRARAALCCARWAHLCRTSPVLWESVALHGLLPASRSLQRVEGFLAWLTPRAAGVQSLTIAERRSELATDPVLWGERSWRCVHGVWPGTLAECVYRGLSCGSHSLQRPNSRASARATTLPWPIHSSGATVSAPQATA